MPQVSGGIKLSESLLPSSEQLSLSELELVLLSLLELLLLVELLPLLELEELLPLLELVLLLEEPPAELSGGVPKKTSRDPHPVQLRPPASAHFRTARSSDPKHQ